MRIKNNKSKTIVLLEQETEPFTKGFEAGIIGHCLGFNNKIHCFLKTFEKKAFDKGYEIGNQHKYRDFFHDNEKIPVHFYILLYCIKEEIIEPKGWKICRSLAGTWYLDNSN